MFRMSKAAFTYVIKFEVEWHLTLLNRVVIVVVTMMLIDVFKIYLYLLQLILKIVYYMVLLRVLILV